MKTGNYVIVLLALTIAIAAIATSSNPVAADSCIAQLSYPVMPAVYTYSNIPIIVPVSATCTTYYSSQLYATGNAYDATSSTNLGSVSTILTSVSGGTIFNGQLGFNLPPTTQGHSVQISVSIYNSQYGSLITATSLTILVGSTAQQVTTTTVTQQAPYPYPYPYSSPPYQYQSQLHPFQNQSQNQAQSSNSATVFGYAAIAAILAAVIIATAGLVTYGRRQQYWQPMQSPPPR
jgi:hypothetical protein